MANRACAKMGSVELVYKRRRLVAHANSTAQVTWPRPRYCGTMTQTRAQVVAVLPGKHRRTRSGLQGMSLALGGYMKTDPIRGKTIRWTFTDGAMANKTFEHSFDDKGSVTFRSTDGNANGKASEKKKYEMAQVSANVCAISYMSNGYTLTVVLDFQTGKLSAFSSNEKELALQHGMFQDVTDHSEAGRTHHKDAKPVSGPPF